MIKALHVVGGLKLEEGGPSVSILNICAASALANIRPHVAAVISDTSEEIVIAIEQRVRSTQATFSGFPTIPFLRRRARRWGISYRLAVWLGQHVKQFDIVVVHGAWLFSSVAAFACALLFSKPCVLVPHESLTEFDVQRGQSPWRRFAKQQLKRMYLRHCSLLVFASELECRNTLENASAATTAVLHHPIFDNRNPTSLTVRPVPTHVSAMGFLGRLDPKKNLNVLIEALAECPSHIRLLVAGEGPVEIKSELQKLATERGVADRIAWMGFVRGAQKEKFFGSIDLLAMPSAFESFGMSAAEAMVRGVPVIVSPTTGIAEVIRRFGGGIVSPPEAEALAKRIRDLDSNPDILAELSRSGAEVARTELSLSAFGRDLASHYEQILSR